jgi:hypothetical protein
MPSRTVVTLSLTVDFALIKAACSHHMVDGPDPKCKKRSNVQVVISRLFSRMLANRIVQHENNTSRISGCGAVGSLEKSLAGCTRVRKGHFSKIRKFSP